MFPFFLMKHIVLLMRQQGGLLQFTLGPGLLELLHGVFAVLLGPSFEEGVWQVGDGVLSLLKSQASEAPDDLDAGDLLRGVGVGDDEVELGLLLGSGTGVGSTGGGAGGGDHDARGRGRVHAESLLDLLDEVGGLQEGDALQLLDNLIGSGGAAHLEPPRRDVARRAHGRDLSHSRGVRFQSQVLLHQSCHGVARSVARFLVFWCSLQDDEQ
mmetsp:Transcript_26179/g.55951  ORF Transcript_26179/g.55951 Transcript_26179/m.55951 type:complete len:212 (+) Transcript_26179:43-678(+)